jgi:hypothetical protein
MQSVCTFFKMLFTSSKSCHCFALANRTARTISSTLSSSQIFYSPLYKILYILQLLSQHCHLLHSFNTTMSSCTVSPAPPHTVQQRDLHRSEGNITNPLSDGSFTQTIVGCVIGGILLMVIITLILCLYRDAHPFEKCRGGRKKRKNTDVEGQQVKTTVGPMETRITSGEPLVVAMEAPKILPRPLWVYK